MNEIETLIQQSASLDAQGEKDEALSVLSSAFDLLVDAAGAYAKTAIGTEDTEVLRSNMTQILEHSNAYLRKTLTAAMILNSMGLLFMELGEFDAAAQKFQESIGLIPEGLTYTDPSENMQALQVKITAAHSAEDEIDSED